MDALAELVLRYGLTLLFLNVFLEQVGVPIPALPTLVVAGALVADGKLSVASTLAVALAASLLADSIWFGLGRSYGRRILKLLCRVSLSPDSCVRQTEGAFERWGASSLLVAKFVPGFSTVAPPLAGASGVRFGRFLLFSTAGTLLWAGAALLAGVLFRDAIDELLTRLAALGTRAVVLASVLLALYVAMKWWQRRSFFKALRMARISAHELHHRMQDDPAPLVVDVRTDAGRMQDPRRIPGAIVIDVERLDEEIRRLPTSMEIVLYCT